MISEIIYMKRKVLGLSREKTAEGICNPSTLYRYENNSVDISTNLMLQICERLHIENINVFQQKLTIEENRVYKLIMDAIYYKDIENLQIILEKYKNKLASKYFSKILDWASAVYLFFIEEYDLSKKTLYSINPKLKINDLIDLNILNSLSLIYIVEKKWDNAQRLLIRCRNSNFFIECEEYKITTKITYNLAFTYYYTEDVNLALKLLEEMIYSSKINNNSYMLGNIYHFLYVCYTDLEFNTVATEYLKKAYYSFALEDNKESILKNVIEPDLKKEGLSLWIEDN